MDFITLFKTFKKSAFRLEGLPHYEVTDEQEQYGRFLKSGDIDPTYNKEWTDTIKAAVERGASMKRLRLISDPLTNYEEFELLSYKTNSEAGEEIRAMDRDDWPWTGDFWFFDTTWIVRMHYDENGAFVGTEITEADEDDKADLEYWMDIYESAPLIQDIYKVD
jgi:hypothetical protein